MTTDALYTFSVHELTRYVRTLLERDRTLQRVRVQGEISDFVAHTSGHLYFTLKDESAQLRCVMFRDQAGWLEFRPADGLSVLAVGAITVYEPRGQYQLIVEQLVAAGRGALFEAFERLKAKLKAEGLFEPERKRPLPAFPRRIAIVTSRDGAALHDIMRVLRRRWPIASVALVPAAVSGAAAAPALAAAIRSAGRLRGAQCVIVARGGGAVEELSCFNDEAVARAIAGSPLPVVTGIGHETDFTIADFVADLRAPTPSAAAEQAVPDRATLLHRLSVLQRRAGSALSRRAAAMAREFALVTGRRALASPAALLNQRRQLLDDLTDRAQGVLHSRLRGLGRELDLLARRRPLVSPTAGLGGARALVRTLERHALAAARRCAEQGKQRLAALHTKADALSPRAALARGYSITLRLPERAVVRSARQIASGDRAQVLLSDGSARVRVDEVQHDESP
jgi:exodeoxyribonuclease VII large subunit